MQSIQQIEQMILGIPILARYKKKFVPIQNVLDQEENSYPIAVFDYVSSQVQEAVILRQYSVYILDLQKQSDADLNKVISQCELDLLAYIAAIDNALYTSGVTASNITPLRQFTSDYTAGVKCDLSISITNDVVLC